MYIEFIHSQSELSVMYILAAVDLVQYIAMIVIRRTLLSNLNAHRTVIIQYYFASNSVWLFSFYSSVIFSLFTLWRIKISLR